MKSLNDYKYDYLLSRGVSIHKRMEQMYAENSKKFEKNFVRLKSKFDNKIILDWDDSVQENIVGSFKNRKNKKKHKKNKSFSKKRINLIENIQNKHFMFTWAVQHYSLPMDIYK